MTKIHNNPLLLKPFLRQILRYNLRHAPSVNRLIDATLIGNFFHAPFFFQTVDSGALASSGLFYL